MNGKRRTYPSVENSFNSIGYDVWWRLDAAVFPKPKKA
jgi:hypothetical protein